MEKVSYETLLAVVVAVLAICGAINVVGATIKTVKEWRQPQMQRDASQNDAIEQIMGKLSNDKNRIDAHETAIADLRAGQRCLCEGVQALLNHALHNGNTNEMQTASTSINKWLRNRN